MSPATKLIISLVIAAIAATLTAVLFTGALFEPLLLAAFGITAVVCTLLGGAGVQPGRPASGRPASGRPASGRPASGRPASRQVDSRHSEDSDYSDAPLVSGDREQGTVKWFNVSKGFGFIIREDGEEIFVHFRSIRGTGRRGLRDGQAVSFIVADSDKGPQAEDVIPEE